jgi:hypothetical protein
MGTFGQFPARFQAGGNGFEPLLTDPESVVLPLDEPPKGRKLKSKRREIFYQRTVFPSRFILLFDCKVLFSGESRVVFNVQDHK